MKIFIFFLNICFVFLFSLKSDTHYKDSLKIATYNVENLFDSKIDGYEYKEFKSLKWNKINYHKKIDNIKKVIKDINADIVALQEIENENVLKDLIKNTDYKFYVFSKQKKAPIGLGLISKIKPNKYKEIKISPIKTRNILRVDFYINNKMFNIFVVHFPAFKNGVKHQKISKTFLKRAILNLENVIILGDFNSPYGKLFLYNDFDKFKNLWDFVDAKRRYSYPSNKRAIDHILVSENLRKIFYKNKSFGVFSEKYLFDKKGHLLKNNKKNVFSDHLPLFFEIEI